MTMEVWSTRGQIQVQGLLRHLLVFFYVAILASIRQTSSSSVTSSIALSPSPSFAPSSSSSSLLPSSTFLETFSHSKNVYSSSQNLYSSSIPNTSLHSSLIPMPTQSLMLSTEYVGSSKMLSTSSSSSSSSSSLSSLSQLSSSFGATSIMQLSTPALYSSVVTPTLTTSQNSTYMQANRTSVYSSASTYVLNSTPHYTNLVPTYSINPTPQYTMTQTSSIMVTPSYTHLPTTRSLIPVTSQPTPSQTVASTLQPTVPTAQPNELSLLEWFGIAVGCAAVFFILFLIYHCHQMRQRIIQQQKKEMKKEILHVDLSQGNHGDRITSWRNSMALDAMTTHIELPREESVDMQWKDNFGFEEVFLGDDDDAQKSRNNNSAMPQTNL